MGKTFDLSNVDFTVGDLKIMDEGIFFRLFTKEEIPGGLPLSHTWTVDGNRLYKDENSFLSRPIKVLEIKKGKTLFSYGIKMGMSSDEVAEAWKKTNAEKILVLEKELKNGGDILIQEILPETSQTLPIIVIDNWNGRRP